MKNNAVAEAPNLKKKKVSELPESLPIYQTRSYSRFKEIEGNRPADPKHIKEIVDSINNNGMLKTLVIVNEKFEVIDGQHRLNGAKETDTPVFFIMVKGYGLDEVRALNLNKSNWKNKDYLHGYVEEGNEDYVKLNNFYNKYSSLLRITDCMLICAETPVLATPKKFREGSFKFGDWEEAEGFVYDLISVRKYYDGFNRTGFVRALIAAKKRKDFEMDIFLKKLKLQSHKMIDCGKEKEYLILMESIYNYKNRDKINLIY
jgi:CRISPR/Cas system CMR-associated protein Cmr5 small subunit